MCFLPTFLDSDSKICEGILAAVHWAGSFVNRVRVWVEIGSVRLSRHARNDWSCWFPSDQGIVVQTGKPLEITTNKQSSCIYFHLSCCTSKIYLVLSDIFRTVLKAPEAFRQVCCQQLLNEILRVSLKKSRKIDLSGQYLQYIIKSRKTRE